MIERYLAQMSTYAGDIDGLILLVGVLVGFWFFAAEGMFFWLIWKFRERPGVKSQYLTGKEAHVKRWITWPHGLVLVCDVFIVVGSIMVWNDVKQTLPEADSTIRIIGQQWAWTFQHPGPDNELDTPDDIFTVAALHIEVGKVYHFKLESRDVLHSFSVPVFRLKQDALPGRSITGWFEATATGEHDIQCAEICGIGHGVMAARIFIEDASQHAAWVAANSNSTTP
ncbi:MAG: cytochrome C oxidase subunit II [Gemmatimonadetes bacterium]|nr:cytochrome C oxidase subunit II [Gemmatimonadota bacterium]